MADTGKKISDADKALMRRMMGRQSGNVISDADKALMRRMKPKLKRSEMNEITALEMQRSLNPYSDADRELLRRQPTRKPKKMEKGGAVCRGGRSAERGTQFRGVR